MDRKYSLIPISIAKLMAKLMAMLMAKLLAKLMPKRVPKRVPKLLMSKRVPKLLMLKLLLSNRTIISLPRKLGLLGDDQMKQQSTGTGRQMCGPGLYLPRKIQYIRYPRMAEF